MERNVGIISQKVFIRPTMMLFTFYGYFVRLRDQYWLVATNVICRKPNNRLFLSQVDCLSFRGSIHFHTVYLVISPKVRQCQYPVAIGLVFFSDTLYFDNFIWNLFYRKDTVKLKLSFISYYCNAILLYMF